MASASMPDPAIARFEASMRIDREAWHDGRGYDLDALAAAGPEGRRRIEALLLARGVRDWRDVEALAALDSEAARERVRAAAEGPQEVAVPAAVFAPDWIDLPARARILAEAVRRAPPGPVRTLALLEVERFHPPDVVEALLGATLTCDGVDARHAAALLLMIHGQAESPWDPTAHTFLLGFATDDPAERADAHGALRARIAGGDGPVPPEDFRP